MLNANLLSLSTRDNDETTRRKTIGHVYYLEELNKQVASSKAKISTPSVSVNHSPEYQRKKITTNYLLHALFWDLK